MTVPHYAHALYLIATSRRLAAHGLGAPSIDPKATAQALERELAGGDPAPSWTLPPLPKVVMPDLSAAFGGSSYAPPVRALPPVSPREERPDVIVCECGAAVSWAVYLDHHGCRPRDPDPTEDTTEPVECECGAVVLGAGWMTFHRKGVSHRNRMSRKRAVAALWRAA